MSTDVWPIKYAENQKFIGYIDGMNKSRSYALIRWWNVHWVITNMQIQNLIVPSLL